MSRVYLIAADKPLPLCEKHTLRTKTVTVEGQTFTISIEAGFSVRNHEYYRGCVDELGLTMKPHQYELELEACEEDLSALKTYLEDNVEPGESVELWNLWVGIDRLGAVPHYRRPLSDLDMDTLEQFEKPLHRDGGIGQCQLTVTV